MSPNVLLIISAPDLFKLFGSKLSSSFILLKQSEPSLEAISKVGIHLVTTVLLFLTNSSAILMNTMQNQIDFQVAMDLLNIQPPQLF